MDVLTIIQIYGFTCADWGRLFVGRSSPPFSRDDEKTVGLSFLPDRTEKASGCLRWSSCSPVLFVTKGHVSCWTQVNHMTHDPDACHPRPKRSGCFLPPTLPVFVRDGCCGSSEGQTCCWCWFRLFVEQFWRMSVAATVRSCNFNRSESCRVEGQRPCQAQAQ